MPGLAPGEKTGQLRKTYIQIFLYTNTDGSEVSGEFLNNFKLRDSVFNWFYRFKHRICEANFKVKWKERGKAVTSNLFF